MGLPDAGLLVLSPPPLPSGTLAAPPRPRQWFLQPNSSCSPSFNRSGRLKVIFGGPVSASFTDFRPRCPEVRFLGLFFLSFANAHSLAQRSAVRREIPRLASHQASKPSFLCWRSLRVPCAFSFSRSQYSISAMDSRVCSATTLSFALSSEMGRFSGFAGIRPVFLRLSFAGSSYHRACTFRANFSEVLPARLDGSSIYPHDGQRDSHSD